MNPEIQRLISMAGGQGAFAREVGRSQQTVSKWLHGITQPGARSALAIEKTYGTPAHVIRPDIFL